MDVDTQGKPLQKGGITYLKSHDVTGSGTGVALRGHFNISITGTWVGTVQIETSIDNITFYPVDGGAFTANAQTTGFEASNTAWARSTFTRTSGTAVVRMYQ
jgi:hypothetical protein